MYIILIYTINTHYTVIHGGIWLFVYVHTLFQLCGSQTRHVGWNWQQTKWYYKKEDEVNQRKNWSHSHSHTNNMQHLIFVGYICILCISQISLFVNFFQQKKFGTLADFTLTIQWFTKIEIAKNQLFKKKKKRRPAKIKHSIGVWYLTSNWYHYSEFNSWERMFQNFANLFWHSLKLSPQKLSQPAIITSRCGKLGSHNLFIKISFAK